MSGSVLTSKVRGDEFYHSVKFPGAAPVAGKLFAPVSLTIKVPGGEFGAEVARRALGHTGWWRCQLAGIASRKAYLRRILNRWLHRILKGKWAVGPFFYAYELGDTGAEH